MLPRVLIALPLLLASISSAADRAPQVVGGEPVDAGAYPFVVRVNLPGATCTGSLIRNNWVLTAAHCGGNGTPLSVLIGDAQSQTDGPTHIVASLPVAQWIPHPEYNPATSDNDIALIRLASDATQSPPRINGSVQYTPQPIQLANSPSMSGPSLGTVGVVGFGRVDTPASPGVVLDNPGFAFVATNLSSRTVTDCASLGRAVNSGRQLCYASYPNACHGDSGGPVFRTVSGTRTQVGVVAYGPEICGTGPSVATFVPGYAAWINQQIDGTAPASPIKYGWELPQSAQDGVATGVSNAQGWAFSTAGTITSIRLERNGQHFATLPCCSERGDVQGANPAAPVLSGFSAAINWGLLGDGTSNLTLVIRDSAGNERRDTRSVKSVQVLDGRPFVSGLGFTQSTFCQLFNQGGRAFADCSGLSFQQGTCNGHITFGWQNGKQAFEVVEGCH